jgi:hypothetical protein
MQKNILASLLAQEEAFPKSLPNFLGLIEFFQQPGLHFHLPKEVATQRKLHRLPISSNSYKHSFPAWVGDQA